MPIYEYQCEACGAHLEKLQKISDPVLKDCPECQKPSLKKLISATSFRLKGTGWYETDFKTGNKKHGTEDKPGSSSASKDTNEKSGNTGTAGTAGKDSGNKADSAKSKEPAKSSKSATDAK
jgi:putative FmdB family regulatory protein